MGKALIIGAGGVASVAIHKCVQNSEVFEEICIASRTKSKCDELKAKLDGGKTKITTAQVDANNVEELIALINEVKPDIVMNLALPYQDLTIMDACLATKTHYMDTANYEPEDTAKFEYKWQWEYRERFEKAGITALLGSGFDPGVTGVFSAYALKHHFDEIEYIDILDSTPAITAILSLPTSTRKSTSAKSRPTEDTGKKASGSKPNRWRSNESTTSLRSAKKICTCCTTRNWNPLRLTSPG
ncbi:hypothetical protein HMSSN036_25540 [Paenibacillus macerans]|nr:hypothetical protein HMSSN036_25540 [Paenibacillus macerans]